MRDPREPVERSVAMPYQILVAMLSLASLWGWSREAAAIALSCGALLRIGEVTAARRADLFLPSDVSWSTDFALLRIKEPKTRFRAASSARKAGAARLAGSGEARVITAI